MQTRARSTMNHISVDEFSNLLSRYSLDANYIKERSILKQIRDNWMDIIGPIYTSKTYPASFKNGILYITVVHSSYSMEITFLKKDILEKVGKITFLYDMSIKKLVAKVGNIPQNRSSIKYPQQENVPTKNIPPEYLEIIAKEEDPEAKKKLLELLQILA
jgi:hypothetical protein